MLPTDARRALWLPAMLALLAGCPQDEQTEPADDDDSAESVALDLDSLVGGVRIEETTSDGAGGSTYAYVWPWGIYDVPYPGNLLGVVWGPYGLTVTEEQGDCFYLESLGYGFCDPLCGSDEYCSAEDQCEPWPRYRDAGTMTVSGLSEPLTITPSEHGYYSVDWVCCPERLFAGGEVVELQAEGGETPGFQITTVAVEPIEPALDCEMTVEDDADLEITWTPSEVGGTVRWEMTSAPHAGQGPMVLCEGDDVGSMTVPRALVGRFLAEKRYYEIFRLSRYQRAWVGIDQGRQVALEVAAVRRCDR